MLSSCFSVKRSIGFCFMAFAFFLCVFAPKLSFAENTLEKIKKQGSISVCSESGYLPLEMRSQNGTWVGFDVAMVEAFAKSLKVKLIMIDTKWDGIIPSLMSKKCDLIASSMAKTPERANAVLFSDSYYKNNLLIATKNTEENKKKFKTIEDFNRSDVSVAVKTGSSPDLFLQNSGILSKAKILKYDADADTVHAVLEGKTTAFIYDTPYVKIAALNNPNKLYIVPKGFNGDEFGVAFRKQDKELAESFNQFLNQWKASGEYEKNLHEYFETTQWMNRL